MVTGCKSTDKPDSARFASVEIHGNTPGQIGNMAVTVFREKDYTVAKRTLTNLVFEKEGSSMQNVAYGNWIGDTPIWVRVKVSIVTTGETKCRLECHAFLLRGRGESTEEEIHISHFRSGPYQKLLDEVAKRLKGSGEGLGREGGSLGKSE